MQIWEIRPDVKRSALNTDHTTKDIEIIRDNFTGISMKDLWKPIKLQTFKKGSNKNYFYLITGVPVFNRNVVEGMTPLIENYVEFLPAFHEEFELFMVNVFVAENVINFDKTKLTRRSNGKIESIEEIHFIPHEVAKYPIFKVEYDLMARVYVNEEFFQLVKRLKFKGFEFILVWDDEQEEINEENLEQFNLMLSLIQSYKGNRYKWEEAMKLVNQGKTVISNVWKISKNSNGNLEFFLLKEDCQYHLLNLHYIPPYLLFEEWYEISSQS